MLRYFNLNNRNFYLPLFLLFFTYIVLRAFFVYPFCDEVQTIFDYIETGGIWEETPNLASANNHLLVTYIGRFIYNVVGDNLFLFRLVSVLSFVVYFFVCLKLVRETIQSRFNVLIFLGLISVAWIDDFFSYARGYAFALSIFFLCIYLFIQWKNDFKLKNFVLILLLSWLIVFSNLAFLNSVFVLLGYSILLLILNFRKIEKTNLLFHLGSIVLYLVALFPLISYSFELKEAGALWWGNNYSWWESVIKILMELTFFKVEDWFFYVFLSLFLTLIIWTISQFRKIGFISFIHSSKGIVTLLLFGHIVLSELLVLILGVNYPSDRVAMIYVLLFLMVLGFVSDSNKQLNSLSLLFLFFPITFLFQLNLDTSVYMGHTRVSEKSFNAIKEELKNSKSFDMDGLDYWNYVYEMRNSDTVIIANILNEPNDLVHCFSKYISDVNDDWEPTKYHELIYSEPQSNGRLYRYTKKYHKKCVMDSVFPTVESDDEFIGLLNEFIVASTISLKACQVSITGSLFFDQRPLDFSLVYALTKGEEVKVHNAINLVNYSKSNALAHFEWESPVFASNDSKDKFLCYFWNVERSKVKLKDFQVRIFNLEEY